MLVATTSTGANVIGNISFEVNDKTKTDMTQKAREEAVKLAKAKAEGLAKAAGITLGKIINVTESQGFDYPRPMMALDKAETTNVQPGETEISVTVTLSYSL